MSIVVPLTANDVAINDAAALDLMVDTCVHLATTPAAKDSYGWTGKTQTTGTTYRCRIRPLSTADRLANAATSVVLDAVGYLPRTAYGTVKATSRIQWTHQSGIALSPAVTYEVIGEPIPDELCMRCDLRRVTL